MELSPHQQSKVVAQELIDKGEYVEAWKLLDGVLDDNPEDQAALFLIGNILLKINKLGLGYNIFKYLSTLAPNRPEIWSNLGRSLQTMDRSQEAEEYFKKSLSLDKDNFAALNNLAVIYLNTGRPEQALHYSNLALKIKPEDRDGLAARGMAKLQLHDYATGWDDYDWSIGNDFRKVRIYRQPEEPIWEGEPNQTVVVFREQGFGDEILFSCCIPDMIKTCKKVIIDCDPRLEGMFKRNFPEVDVYGTGYDKDLKWPKDYEIDASLPIGGLPRFFRRTRESITGEKFLEACPKRRIQYRALLDSLGPGKKIGLAWNGGKHIANIMVKDEAMQRSVKLKDLAPLIVPGNHYISLEYKPSQKEIDESGLPVHEFSWATLSRDYDDTAALVSELDYVISVATTMVHLCGALGVECYCLTPTYPNFRFSNQGPMIWHKSVHLFRNRDNWAKVIRTLKSYLSDRGLL